MTSVKLIGYNPNYMEIIKTADSQPYGNNVSTKGVLRIIDSGHISTIEHCNAVFLISCSVRVLGQITRHRHMSFTVKSARGSRFDKMEIPEGLKMYLTDNSVKVTDLLAEYNNALNHGVKEQDAAYLLPQGVQTSMVMSGNLRAWYEYLPKRLCKRAMPEHRKLAFMIHEELKKAMPELFDRNFMNCANCKEKSCEFK